MQGVSGTNLGTVENPGVTAVGPSHMWIPNSNDSDLSPGSIEKYPSIGGPTEFKPLFFMSQLSTVNLGARAKSFYIHYLIKSF